MLQCLSARFYAILLSVENAFPKGSKPAGLPQPPLRKTQLTSDLSIVKLRDVQHFYMSNEQAWINLI